MSEQFYVLMEQGFDYDDQYYTRQDGGSPTKVFTNKKKAEEAAELANIEEFKRIWNDGYIRDYTSGGFDELMDYKATEDDLYLEGGIFMTLLGKSAYDWYKDRYDEVAKFITEPTEEQWKKLYSCFNLSFYEVVTVQKG